MSENTLIGAMSPPYSSPASVAGQESVPHGGFVGPPGALTVAGARVSTPGKRLGAYLLEGLLAVVTLGIGWMIWSIVVWGRGQSPAKQVLGMRCVRLDTGRAAGWGKMALRELVGKSVLGAITFGITSLVSCFMILGQRRQGVWDKLADTAVVEDPDGRLR